MLAARKGKHIRAEGGSNSQAAPEPRADQHYAESMQMISGECDDGSTSFYFETGMEIADAGAAGVNSVAR